MNSPWVLAILLVALVPGIWLLEWAIQQKVEGDVRDWEEREKEKKELKTLQEFDKF